MRESGKFQFPSYDSWLSPKKAKNGANYTEFAWLYLTQNELHETRVIHGFLRSLLGPGKTPLLVRIAQN